MKKYLLKYRFFKGLQRRYIFITDISFALFFINFLFQRIFRLNNDSKYLKHFTSTIIAGNNIYVENDSASVLKSLAVSSGCYIHAGRGIHIGEGTIWAPNVTIVSLGHDFYDYSKSTNDDPIMIGRNCWLGAGAVLLPGIKLGDHTIVGANSVVTKSFTEGNMVIAGAPAKKIKEL